MCKLVLCSFKLFAVSQKSTELTERTDFNDWNTNYPIQKNIKQCAFEIKSCLFEIDHNLNSFSHKFPTSKGPCSALMTPTLPLSSTGQLIKASKSQCLQLQHWLRSSRSKQSVFLTDHRQTKENNMEMLCLWCILTRQTFLFETNLTTFHWFDLQLLFIFLQTTLWSHMGFKSHYKASGCVRAAATSFAL